MRKFYHFILFVSVTLSCNNIDSTEPSPMNSFIRFYEGPYSFTAKSVEKIPGGFVILSTMVSGSVSDPVIQTVLIETDENGTRIGDYKIYDDIVGRSFKPILTNGSVQGYIVVGDSVTITEGEEQSANLIRSAMKILVLNSSFGVIPEKSKSVVDTVTKDSPVTDDITGVAVTISKDGKVYVLGTFKKGIVNQQNAPEEQLLYALDNNLESAWIKRYPLLGNTFANSKSIHERNGNIVWASAIAEIQGDFTTSYVAIPFVPENSFPSNYSMIGENTKQLYLPKDIQPASSPEFGYGVTGTYSSNTDGSNGNIFFLQVDTYGDIIPGSERFFDGGTAISEADKNSSAIIDNGETLIGTSDGGFVLAGTIINPESKDKDILLIKINAFGDQLWTKRMGASGDEQPVSLKETTNGDIIVCGTNSLGGYSSVFLMKMDKNGELKN